MNIHKNARTTPYSRLLMARRVGAGERVVKVAADFCVSAQTVLKWPRRWQVGGEVHRESACRQLCGRGCACWRDMHHKLIDASPYHRPARRDPFALQRC
jgi:transposase-like protein